MYYKYPPVYKYIILLILITTFLKYYKIITKENYLLIASVFAYMVFVFDYVLIEEHPKLFDESSVSENSKKTIYIKKKKHSKKGKNKKQKIKIIDDTNKLENTEFDIQDSMEEKDLSELDKEIESFDNLNETDTDNLTEEIQKELDQLDL